MRNVTISLGNVLEFVNMDFTAQTVTSNVLVNLIQSAILIMEHVGAPWVLLASGAAKSVLRGNLVINVSITALAKMTLSVITLLEDAAVPLVGLAQIVRSLVQKVGLVNCVRHHVCARTMVHVSVCLVPAHVDQAMSVNNVMKNVPLVLLVCIVRRSAIVRMVGSVTRPLVDVIAGLDGQENCAKANVHQDDLVQTVNVSVCVNIEGFVIECQVVVAVQPGILVTPVNMHVQPVGMVLPVRRYVTVEMAPVVTLRLELVFVFLGGLEKIAEHVVQLVAMAMAVSITVNARGLSVITSLENVFVILELLESHVKKVVRLPTMVLNVRTSVTVCQMEGVISRLVLANVMNSILVRSVVTMLTK